MKLILNLLLATMILCGCSAVNVKSTDMPVQIHDLQGCDHRSPYEGKSVNAVQGLVTWKDEQGFFMQGTSPDDKECTSEGIYVFTKQYSRVIPGDLVIVGGKVVEFVPESAKNEQLTVTEIESSSVKIISSNHDLPAPMLISASGRTPPDRTIEDDGFSVFDPSTDGIDFYESLEGMRVQVNSALAVSSEDSYREVYIVPANLAEKNTISAQGALLASSEDMNPERIVVVLPVGFKKTINLGTQFTQPIIGILHYEYGNYEIIETNVPAFKANTCDFNSLTSKSKEDVLRITTYNTENLSRYDDSRIQGLARQIVRSLEAPDILVLQEIEDDSGTQDDNTVSARKTLEKIIQSVEDAGGPNYSFEDEIPQNNSSGGINGGNIRTVFLYRTDNGLKLEMDSIKLPRQNISVFKNSRIPVVRLFNFHGQPFYIIGVHLISNSANSPLFGSIQPVQKPDDEKRLAQAKWISVLAGELESQNPEAALLIAGDFNDTPVSEPLKTFSQIGFTNLAEKISPAERYSILFQGNAFLYDQILFNPGHSSLSATNAAILHLNTCFPEKTQNSDHDPFIIELAVKK